MIMIRPKRAILLLAGLLSFAAPMAMVVSADAAEQCRFITAKAEREACYARQEADLAAKRNKQESKSVSKSDFKRDTTMEALQQMKQDDQTLDRQIHGICRGC
jgi:hypothetical protein